MATHLYCSKRMDQPGRVANPARCELTQTNSTERETIVLFFDRNLSQALRFQPREVQKNLGRCAFDPSIVLAYCTGF